MTLVSKMTPMLVQYQAIKENYPGCLLLFRLGDFYEMFFEDAVLASQALDITLTRRGSKEPGEEIPMCGVPFHAADAYIARLIRQGFKVAICEQMESPEDAKKRGYKAVVRREVVRVITPGTLTEDALLEGKSHNYLATLGDYKGALALCVIDISTGDFSVEPVMVETLLSTLMKTDPKEVLLAQRVRDQAEVLLALGDYEKCLTIQPNSRFDLGVTTRRLQELLGVQTLESFGNFSPEEIVAAGAALEYVSLTQVGKMPQIKVLKKVENFKFLQLDAATRRNLELDQTLKGAFRGSLLSVLDGTLTNGGGRLLRRRLAEPLYDLQAIHHRLAQVEWMKDQGDEFPRASLAMLPDLERLLGRLSVGRGGPRDLKAVHQALGVAQTVAQWLAGFPPTPVISEFLAIQNIPALQEVLGRALQETLPFLAREGDFIAPGYHKELDGYRELRDQGRYKIMALQQQLAEEAGVPGLKIKHNNVLGYFVEITPLHKDKLTASTFIHRQTLSNVMRFTTSTLMELEQKLVSAGDLALALELRLFDELLALTHTYAPALYALAQAFSALDVTLSFATLATKWHYTKPTVTQDQAFAVVGGRHAVMEQLLHQQGGHAFTPNDCALPEEARLWLLTGPNMAGKSTFLRQNALLVILAQMGSFVPAESLHLGLVDRIFTRVGASDDLSKGQSTFMVEMVETATILNQATPKSFVILDEVGRGTATYDGVALAWAVMEYLHDHNKCRGIFATHYHELTVLETQLTGVWCYSMAVKEWQQQVVFLHRVIPGAAEGSYGIYVAKLAGIPGWVLQRAGHLLAALENPGQKNDLTTTCKNEMFQDSHIVEKLCSIDPNGMTPKEALELLYTLQGMAKTQQ